MPTIIKDKFSNNSEVTLDMCDDILYVFVWFKGIYQGVRTWPQDSYHLPVALAYYQEKVTEILRSLADEIE